MYILDDMTGETSGLVTVLPILAKNIYELYSSNKEIARLLSSQNPDRIRLKKLRGKLAEDIIDILNAIVIALPMTFADSFAVIIINMLEEAIASGTAAAVTYTYKGLLEKAPKIARVFDLISYPLGGKIILQSLENIDILSDDNIENTISGIIDDTDMPVIDITPEENHLELPENRRLALPRPSVDDKLAESINMKRFCLLAGV